MDTQGARSLAGSLLQPLARSMTIIEPDRIDVEITAGRLLDAIAALRRARWGYLAAITGIDVPPSSKAAAGSPADEDSPQGWIEVLYHFCEAGAVATLRVAVPYGSAVLPSIGELIPSARLYEVELSEMFGIAIQGLPMKHLLLPDDWPDGVYPLRKSFTGARVVPPGSAS